MDNDDNRTLAEMALQLKTEIAAHTEAKKAAAIIWNRVDQLRFIDVPAKMEEMEIESVKILGVGRLGIREEMSCKTKQKRMLMDWFRENDMPDMIQEVINASTLKAFLREQLREGGEIPNDDIIDMNTYKVAVITKG